MKPNQNLSTNHSKPTKAAAFSMVELLAVVALLGVLATLALPALSGILRGNALRAASDQVWVALASARDEAMTRGGEVAFVIASREDSAETPDAFLLAQAIRSETGVGGWTWDVISPWRALPRGARVAPMQANDFLGSGSGAAVEGLLATLPPLSGDPAAFAILIFHADGGVIPAASAPKLGIRHENGGTEGVAEVAIVLNPDSGRPRLVRF